MNIQSPHSREQEEGRRVRQRDWGREGAIDLGTSCPEWRVTSVLCPHLLLPSLAMSREVLMGTRLLGLMR